MKAIKFGLLIAGAVLAANSAKAQHLSSVPVNVQNDAYAFAYFPVTNEPADYATYNADPANNKSAFNIHLTGGATSGSDTVNMVWGTNAPATISIGFTPGNLPGTWQMQFDGAGITGPNQAFTTDAQDIGQIMAVPVKLMVSDVGLNTPAGNYSGSLSIVSVTTP